jgi:hypothetical protein
LSILLCGARPPRTALVPLATLTACGERPYPDYKEGVAHFVEKRPANFPDLTKANDGIASAQRHGSSP